MMEKLEKFGLYDPADEHDACGVGFIAAIDGKPRREVVLMAISALENLWHRGAVDADVRGVVVTGRAAGVMSESPLHATAALVDSNQAMPSTG